MKKKFIMISIGVFILVIGIFIGTNLNKGDSFDDDTSASKPIVKENTLSMMIEQTVGAGDYKMETRTSWPTDGYMFNETLSKCENGGELGWDSEKDVVTMTGNMSDKCYIYFDLYVPTLSDYCSDGSKLSTCIKTFASGEVTDITAIYYHSSNLTNGAEDNSYRYAGASDIVNNYVCFGNGEATCPIDNLYRIIGVFGDQVKLIKHDYATSTLLGTDGYYDEPYDSNSKYLGGDYSNVAAYFWSYNAKTRKNSNTWSTSLLNQTNLNTNFINNIGTTWASKIATTTWKVGGNLHQNIIDVVPATTYANEITNPVTTNTTDNASTYSAKIGLMYVSDYGFAAAPSAWTTIMNSYSTFTSVNWMYMGLNEWILTRKSDSDYTAFTLDYSGNMCAYAVYAFAIRPVFYLTSDVTYKSGTGTSSDPIRIE